MADTTTRSRRSPATPAAADAAPARAQARYVRITPMKARRMVDMIRGQQADQALAVLRFAPQAAGETVYKVLASAVANARYRAEQESRRLDVEDLVVQAAYVDEGPTLKRFRPRAQGRAFRVRKRSSHITVIVAPRPELDASGNPVKGQPAAASAPAPRKRVIGRKAPASRAGKAPAAKAAKAAASKTAEKAPAKKAGATKAASTATSKATTKKATAKKADSGDAADASASTSTAKKAAAKKTADKTTSSKGRTR